MSAAFFEAPQIRNAAVKIVAPADVNIQQDLQAGAQKSTQSPKKSSVQRQCRNIMIHGFCKYEGKGCIYHHPQKEDSFQDFDSAEPGTQELPSDNSASALSAQAVNAPVFVPRSVASPQLSERTVISPVPPSTGGYENSEQSEVGYDASGMDSMDELAQHVDSMTVSGYEDMTGEQMLLSQTYGGISALDPFYESHHIIQQPLNYHIYTLPVPTSEGRKFFITDNLREELLKRAERNCTGPPPGLGLPEEVQGYHSLVPLELAVPERKRFGTWSSLVYKAVKSSDGRAYALRRIENYRLMTEQAFSVLEKWLSLQHPGVVSVREAFTTRAFGDNSLVVAYDFYPNAQTLTDAHFKKPSHQSNGRAQTERIAEPTLWSYIYQIASAIKAVHDSGLAVRVVDASKILITGRNRVRISSCAIIDILLYDTRQDVQLMQQEDMIMFAKLIMSLACNNPAAVNSVHKSLDQIHRNYPGPIKDIIHFLMKAPGPMKSMQGLFDTFGGKFVAELDNAHAAIDTLEGELMGELENARLVRLLCKFGFINERPEFDRDPRWSETGDRYIIKLFRDFVFHSVDENGNPVVNLGHVLTHLNKLDVGSDERLMLISRDEQSCLVVTYREVKNCIEAAFSDLTRGNMGR